jgi:hypothetical protein
VSDVDKARAFDLLALVLVNRWHDGRWGWWCPQPCGGEGVRRETRDEAIADLIEWARGLAPTWARKNGVKIDGGTHPLSVADTHGG